MSPPSPLVLAYLVSYTQDSHIVKPKAGMWQIHDRDDNLHGIACPFDRLVPQGADVNAVDGDGLPMLSLAAASGHLECVEVLVENSADVNTQTKRWGRC